MLVLVFAGALASLATISAAQDSLPSTTTHYKFLPRLSFLHVSGGESPILPLFNVVGTFDFTTTLSPTDVFPPIIIGDFHNVQAGAQILFQNFAINLDEAINLSGLTGISRQTGPMKVFRFTGETEDGSDVALWAATLGPWMYMRGETTPDEIDGTEYRIRALAHERPFADFNDDGVVDGADLARWLTPSGHLNADFLTWQRQFGESPPLEADFEVAIAAASSTAAAAPEPASLALLMMAIGGAPALRRRTPR
jgi:hypothetical protein